MNTSTLLRYAKVLFLIDYKGGKCEICGLDGIKNSWLMEFHHLDPNIKEFEVKSRTESFDTIKSEVDKCQLLCCSCHKTVHFGLEEYEKNKEEILNKFKDIKSKNGAVRDYPLLTDEEKKIILEKANSGTSNWNISKETGKNYQTIKSFLYRSGIKARRPKKEFDINKDEVKKLYEGEESLLNISKKFNTCPQIIKKILINAGVNVNTKVKLDDELIKKMNFDGKTPQEISKALGVGPSSIYRAIKRLGLKFST